VQEGLIADLEGKVNEMDEVFGSKLKAAEEFLTEDGSSFEDWVSQALYTMIDEGNAELQEYLELQHKKLSLKFH
jgi:hypothetical protein